MAEKKNNNNKRKYIFQKEEINVILEEVKLKQQHRIVSRFKGSHTNKEKFKIWDDIATKLTATRGIKDQGRRSGRRGRTIQALLKEKGHCRGQQLIKQVVGLLTPPSYSRRRKGTTASDGICGGIDLHGGVWLRQPEREPLADTYISQSSQQPIHAPVSVFNC